MIIQVFYSTIQGLTEIVEFCERLETAEGNLQAQGEWKHQKQKLSSPVNAINKPSWRIAKVGISPGNPQKRMITKFKK